MSDERARALERAWRRSGSVADEAAFLRERLRAGEVSLDRLQLAAHLAHPAARAACAATREPPEDLLGWVGGLEGWGHEVLVRASLAAARLVLPVYERQHPSDNRPHLLVATAEEWLRLPTRETVAKAGDLIQATREVGFHRARYAAATVSLLEVVRAEVEQVLAEDITLWEADRIRIRLAQSGALCTIRPGKASPESPQRVILARSPLDWGQAIKGLRDTTSMSLSEAKLAFYRLTARQHAERAVSQAADPFWARDGLGQEDVRSAIRREVCDWALASPR